MGMRLVFALAITGVVGCSGDDSGQPTFSRQLARDASANEGCVDADDDGYCVRDDCDDDDPEVATLCCVEGADPLEGCPCEEGTARVSCDPTEVADMEVVRNGMHTVLKCTLAERYCQEERWGSCQGLDWI